MDIEAVIKSAKLGGARKAAQVDTCTVFAAALYDVLSTQGVCCQIVTALKKGLDPWAHSVVKVADRYYDSMGEFSADIYRKRARIHPSVALDISYQADCREGCYEDEFLDMHAFYVSMLNKALCGPVGGLAA